MKQAKRNKFACLCIAVILMISTFAGCANPDTPTQSGAQLQEQEPKSPTNTDSEPPPDSKEQIKDNLVVGVQIDLDMMDPQNSGLSVVGRMQPLFYETLVTKTETGEYEPCLAEKFEWVSDTEVVFNLRKGVKFHDASELKASDVKFSIERVAATARHASRYDMLVSAEILDDYTVKFTTTAPNDKFLTMLSRVQHGAAIMSEAFVTAAGDNISKQVCGTGPYKLQNWTPGEQMIVERFDDYWGEKGVTPTITYRVITEDTSRLIALETGEIDIMETLPLIDTTRVSDNSALVLYEIPSVAITYWGFNVSHAPFDNKLLRQAMNYAIDKEAVMSAAGGSQTYQGVLSEGMEGYDPTFATYSYDPEIAKQLITEAGFADGLNCTIYVKSTDSQTMMASQVIQAYAAQVGINVEIVTLESTALMAELAESKHDSYILTASNHDPYTGFAFFYGKTTPQAGNRMFFQNDRLDELFELLPATFETEERQKIIKEMNQIAMDEAAWCPLYGQSYYAGAQNAVKGIRLDSLGWHNYAYAYITVS